MATGDIAEELKGRARRERRALHRPAELPSLDSAPQELLLRWVRADSPSRQWQSLLKLAGASHIETAERLVQSLLQSGWITVDERFVKGSWRLEAIAWTDLAALKGLLGLDSRAERQARSSETISALSEWVDGHPEFEVAARALAGATNLSHERLAARVALLHAVAEWAADQRVGTRRDFALEARRHTKDIKAKEWAWLDAHVDLASLGIERFAPVLWVAGALVLEWGEQRVCNLAALHMAALAVSDVLRIHSAVSPTRYWLVENRASFERLAGQRPDGVALIWLPGRPSSSWRDATAALLDVAPAPAWISADADPAGVEIAMTAATLWVERGLPWEPWRMGAAELTRARRTLPLDPVYDQRTLARLAARSDLPESLVELCVCMRERGIKAEQEGWL